MSNPGVGLQMTSQRNGNIINNKNITPGPSQYDIKYKLSNLEKKQNELLSHRYDNWKKKNDQKDHKRMIS